MPNATSTVWTGLAGNGLWDDPNNWSNGVPPPGRDYASPQDNEAILDNSIATDPFTVTIAGDQAADLVIVRLTDPDGAPSVRLTGSIDLISDVQESGAFGIGTLSLQSGTFEVDGGTIRHASVQQNDPNFGDFGKLIFGDADLYGTATLDLAAIQGDITIGNHASIAVLFAIFEKGFGSGLTTVTVDQDASVSIQGEFILHGTLDIKDGAVTLEDFGRVNGDNFGDTTVIVDGGTFTVTGQGTSFRDVIFAGDMTFDANAYYAVVNNQVRFENLDGESHMTVDLGGNELDISNTGTLDLKNAVIKNGVIWIADGGSLVIDGDTTTDVFQNVTIDATDASSPFVIDLGGHTIRVVNTLDLENVILQNGTIELVDDAEITLGNNAELINIDEEHVNGGEGGGTITLIGNPDVHIEDGTTVRLVRADAGTPESQLNVFTGDSESGTPGVFYIDNGGKLAGAGYVNFSDAAGGPASIVVEGTILADVGGFLAVQATDWNMSFGGTLDAENGSALQMGVVGVENNSNLVNGDLKWGFYIARDSSAIYLAGDGPITTLRGSVVRIGQSSNLFVTHSDGNGGFVAESIESTLTSIGADGNSFDDIGALELLDGRDFTSSNDITNYASLIIDGGVFTAASLDLETNVISTGTFGQIISGTVYGYGTVNGPIVSHGGDIFAQNGTLTVTGDISGSGGGLVADVGATLVLQNDLPSSGFFQLFMYSNSTIEVDGSLGNATAQFAPNAQNATLALNDAHGVHLSIFGNRTGNAIHLINVALPEAGSGPSVEVSRPDATHVVVTVHPSDTVGQPSENDVFTFTGGDLAHFGIHADSDGAGGTLITFTDGTDQATAQVTVDDLTPKVHQGSGNNLTTVHVTNPANVSGSALDGHIGLTTGGAVATGGFSGLEPGSESTDIQAGISTDNAGHITGSVTLDFTSVPPAGTGTYTSPLPSQTLYLEADVYRLAEADIPAATWYLHRLGDDFIYLPLKIINTAAADGFSEELKAEITGVTGDFFLTNPDTQDPINNVGPSYIAAGSTDTWQMYGVHTDDFAPSNQHGTLDVHLVSYGANTSGLDDTDLGTQTVDVDVQFNEYAKASIDGFEQPPTVDTSGGYPKLYEVSLGSYLQGSEPNAHNVAIGNIADVQDMASDRAADFLLDELFDRLSSSFDDIFSDADFLNDLRQMTGGGSGSEGGSGEGGGGGGDGDLAEQISEEFEEQVVDRAKADVKTEIKAAQAADHSGQSGGAFGQIGQMLELVKTTLKQSVEGMVHNPDAMLGNIIQMLTQGSGGGGITAEQSQQIQQHLDASADSLTSTGGVETGFLGGVFKDHLVDKLSDKILDGISGAVNGTPASVLNILTGVLGGNGDLAKQLISSGMEQTTEKAAQNFTEQVRGGLASVLTGPEFTQTLKDAIHGIGSTIDVQNIMHSVLNSMGLPALDILDQAVKQQTGGTGLSDEQKAQIESLLDLNFNDLANDFGFDGDQIQHQLDQPFEQAGEAYDNGLESGQDALRVDIYVDEPGVSLHNVDNLQAGQFDRSNNLAINTSTVGDHQVIVFFTAYSVNPTDSTFERQIEIIYNYSVFADPNPADPTPPPVPHYPPNPSGWVGGDPHLGTFDGLRYDFQAAGEFVLAKSLVAGDNFETQIRTVSTGPGSHVSIIEEAAVAVGSHRVTLDASRAGKLWLDGHAISIGTNGTLNLSGGGSIQHLGSGAEYIVRAAGGEAVTMTTDGYSVSVNVQLGTGFAAGQVAGLLGNANGDYSDDLQLADGSHPGTALTFAQLYTDEQSLANAWRVAQAGSLLDYGAGQDTTTFTDLDFPPAPIALADLPADVVARATAAVDAAGVTDPVTRANAILDYALTGAQSFIDTAVQQQQIAPPAYNANVTVTEAPPPPILLGVTPTAVQFLDNGAASFQVYLTGVLAGAVTVSYAVVDPNGDGYLGAADFGGTLPSGAVTIAAGLTGGVFTIALPDIGTDVSDKLRVQITGISVDGGGTAPTPVSTAVDVTVVNHEQTEGVDAEAAFVEFSGGGTLTHVGNAWTLNLGNLVQAGDSPLITLGAANLAALGANTLSGSYTITSGGTFIVNSHNGPAKLAGGHVAGGLEVVIDNSVLGAHSGTITLNATQNNASGFTAALDPITLTIVDTVVAAPPVLTPVGDQVLEATGPDGAVATFTAIATDNIDGTDPVVFTENGTEVHSGDTFHFGEHIITATATNSAGGVASETFSITVRDTTAPDVADIDDQTVAATGPSGAVVTFAATATDAVDGTDTIVFTENGAVVHSGDVFAIGSHTITATATDNAGNHDVEQFVITVEAADGPPSVQSVQVSPPVAHLGPGDVVTFTVTMSDAVDISGGTPRLLLNDGGRALYKSGTGTDTLTFEYRVGKTNSGQNTPALAVTGFQPAGATITDASGDGERADFSSLAGFTTGVAVDTVAPEVTSVVASGSHVDAHGNGTIAVGDSVTITVHFNDEVTVSGGAPRLHLSNGAYATYAGGSGTDSLTFTYTPQNIGQHTPDLGVTGIKFDGASITDDAGNRAVLDGANVNPDGILEIVRAPKVVHLENGSTKTIAFNGDGTVHDATYTGVVDEPYTSYQVQYGDNQKPQTATYSDGMTRTWSYDSNGVLQERNDENVTGESFVAIHRQFGASGQLVLSDKTLADGTHIVVGHADGLTIQATAADERITGGGANDTFVFSETIGHDTLRDFAAHVSGPDHDTLSLPSSIFDNGIASLLARTTFDSHGATITIDDDDTIAIEGLTQDMVTANPSSFLFHV